MDASPLRRPKTRTIMFLAFTVRMQCKLENVKNNFFLNDLLETQNRTFEPSTISTFWKGPSECASAALPDFCSGSYIRIYSLKKE